MLLMYSRLDYFWESDIVQIQNSCLGCFNNMHRETGKKTVQCTYQSFLQQMLKFAMPIAKNAFVKARK